MQWVVAGDCIASPPHPPTLPPPSPLTVGLHPSWYCRIEAVSCHATNLFLGCLLLTFPSAFGSWSRPYSIKPLPASSPGDSNLPTTSFPPSAPSQVSTLQQQVLALQQSCDAQDRELSRLRQEALALAARAAATASVSMSAAGSGGGSGAAAPSAAAAAAAALQPGGRGGRGAGYGEGGRTLAQSAASVAAPAGGSGYGSSSGSERGGGGSGGSTPQGGVGRR